MDVAPFSSAQSVENGAIQEPRFLGGVLVLSRMANNQRLPGEPLSTMGRR
jgi:hypothetical protein